MTKKYTQEQFLSSPEFEICEQIYLFKYYLEDSYSLEGISNLTFYIVEKDGQIIGFGSRQDNDIFDIIDCNFKDKFEYSEQHTELLNLIVDEIREAKPEQVICLYQTLQNDCDFYLKSGFELYKDYGQDWFLPGSDVMRFVLKQEPKK